jgi:hypothetical protein
MLEVIEEEEIVTGALEGQDSPFTLKLNRES